MACEVRERQGAVALPPEGHPVYTWPADLLQPDVVFLLHVAEEMRSARLARRETATPEELFLNHDHVFRENLVAAYKRMQNPAAVELDNSYRSIEDVVAEVKATIKHLNDQ